MWSFNHRRRVCGLVNPPKHKSLKQRFLKCKPFQLNFYWCEIESVLVVNDILMNCPIGCIIYENLSMLVHDDSINYMMLQFKLQSSKDLNKKIRKHTFKVKNFPTT